MVTFSWQFIATLKDKIYCHRNRKLTFKALNFPLGVIGVLLFVGSLLQLNSGVLATPTKQPRRALGGHWSYTWMSTGSSVDGVAFHSTGITCLGELSWGLSHAGLKCEIRAGWGRGETPVGSHNLLLISHGLSCL